MPLIPYFADIAPLGALQRLGKWGYMSLGLIAAPPCFILPFFLQPKSEAEKPFAQRYWVKARCGLCCCCWPCCHGHTAAGLIAAALLIDDGVLRLLPPPLLLPRRARPVALLMAPCKILPSSARRPMPGSLSSPSSATTSGQFACTHLVGMDSGQAADAVGLAGACAPPAAPPRPIQACADSPGAAHTLPRSSSRSLAHQDPLLLPAAGRIVHFPRPQTEPGKGRARRELRIEWRAVGSLKLVLVRPLLLAMPGLAGQGGPAHAQPIGSVGRTCAPLMQGPGAGPITLYFTTQNRCFPPLPLPLQVPITLYFMTHAYFCLYHALSNVLIRRARAAVARYGSTAQVRGDAAQARRHWQGWTLLLGCSAAGKSSLSAADRAAAAASMPSPKPPSALVNQGAACPPFPLLAQAAVEAVVVFVLAYATAYGETLTIAHFPYYTFKARDSGGGWKGAELRVRQKLQLFCRLREWWCTSGTWLCTFSSCNLPPAAGCYADCRTAAACTAWALCSTPSTSSSPSPCSSGWTKTPRCVWGCNLLWCACRTLAWLVC